MSYLTTRSLFSWAAALWLAFAGERISSKVETCSELLSGLLGVGGSTECCRLECWFELLRIRELFCRIFRFRGVAEFLLLALLVSGCYCMSLVRACLDFKGFIVSDSMCRGIVDLRKMSLPVD